MRRQRTLAMAAGILAAGLVLAACGDDTDDDATDDNGTEDTANGNGLQDPGHPETDEEWVACDLTEGAAPMPDPEGTGDDAETDITLGIFEGWDESYSSAYLFKVILEDQGYTVDTGFELEAGLTYAGVADGEIDFTTDGWFPITHANRIDEFGDRLENLGCWNDNAALSIAVNEDAPITSLDELSENADVFGGQLFGIEPGAGLTDITENEVLPTYDPEGNVTFEISSTPAMLAELDSSISAGRDVVVTLWHPHWAYDAYPIRDLEDPEGALGETEVIYSFGREGFYQDFPNVAQLVRNFAMTPDELAELQNIQYSDEHYGGDDHEAAAREWLEQNPEWLEDLKQGNL